jgi:hypothetical protein
VPVLLAVAPRHHLRRDLRVVLRRERLLRDAKQLVLARDVRAVRIGEPRRRLEQRLADRRPRLAVELARRRGDRALHLDLHRVLGRQRREIRRELGPARRQPREQRALLVEEVAGDRALEVGDRLPHALEIPLVGAAGGEAPRGFEQLGHHLIVPAVRALELREAGEVHGRARIHHRPPLTQAPDVPIQRGTAITP